MESSSTENKHNSIGPDFGSGTYIVQVRKDQVFRIPPPENELYIQRCLSAGQAERRICSYCSFRVFIGILVVAAVVIFGIIGAVIFLAHDNPSFGIQHLTFKQPKPKPKPSLQFIVSVKVKNPNEYQTISYYLKDSSVSLSYKEKEIAEGKFPVFGQDPGNSTTLGISLNGTKLPDEIVKIMSSTKNSKIRVPLSVSMIIGVRFKVARSIVDSTKMAVSCSLVVGKLDKDTQIFSQSCKIS